MQEVARPTPPPLPPPYFPSVGPNFGHHKAGCRLWASPPLGRRKLGGRLLRAPPPLHHPDKETPNPEDGQEEHDKGGGV